MRRSVLLALVLGLWINTASAINFTVADIRIEGLQQVDPGVVFRNFPVSQGDLITQQRLNDATRDLFDSGYFDDVELLRDGDVLVVRVVERPSVALIRLEGNDLIEEENLREALRRSGLDEGDIFRRSALDQIRLELLKVYNEAGRYSATINTDVETLSGNRVALNINIREGDTAVIKQINIVGNQAFDDEELLELFDSGLSNMLSWWTDNDKYARERLAADIERLKSWYLDRGYLRFEVASTQVSISPDQQQVYITINVNEGTQYRYTSIEIAGETGGIDLDQLAEKVTLEEGELFSRRQVTDTQQSLQDELGNVGYLFAKVSPITEFDGEEGVSIRFFLEPGKLTYVRRIDIRGNAITADEVIRREMPQMEGAVARVSDIDKARQRIDRLGFFARVAVDTSPVPGTDDQVDLKVEVEEQTLGEINAGIGFSSSDGVLFQFGLQQDNFLGTGKSFGFNVNSSDVIKELSVNYNNPYYTLDGVSRGFRAYYRERDFEESDLSNYQTNELGGLVNFGYPIDENQRVRLGLGLDLTEVELNTSNAGIPSTITNFLKNKNKEQYLTYNLELGWSANYLNSGFFPTAGHAHDVDLTIALPGGDLTYYQAVYDGRLFIPLNTSQTWALGFRTRTGYADSLDNKAYPFFKNFFAGGLRTVRGYENNSLGPRDSGNDDVLGGNILLTGTAEIIFPVPFLDDKDAWRTSLFFDAGNVYSTECGAGLVNCTDSIELDDIRASTGLAISWLTPVGPVSIAVAQALNDKSGDETESIQFALGRTF